MSQQFDSLQHLQQQFNHERTPDPQTYHKAKLLLSLYRDVVWRMEENLYTLDTEAFSFGGRRLSELIDFLSMDFEGDMDKRRMEDRLRCLSQTKYLVDLVDKALVKLKTYPDYGDLYFTILTRQYIYKYRCTERELLETVGLERTTYYKRKKEAIHLMGVILWGYILPSLKEAWQGGELIGPEHEANIL